MKYVVVPEVATDLQKAEMFAAIIIDRDDYYFTNPNDVYQAAIAAAPDTGMIAVDKVKFEYNLGQIEKALDFASDAITWETTQKWVNEVKVRLQALKDMEG